MPKPSQEPPCFCNPAAGGKHSARCIRLTAEAIAKAVAPPEDVAHDGQPTPSEQPRQVLETADGDRIEIEPKQAEQSNSSECIEPNPAQPESPNPDPSSQPESQPESADFGIQSSNAHASAREAASSSSSPSRTDAEFQCWDMRVNRRMTWIAIAKATGIERHECARLARIEQARIDGQTSEDRGLYTHQSLAVYADIIRIYRERERSHLADGTEWRAIVAAQTRIDELLGLGVPKAQGPAGQGSSTLIALLGDEGVARLVERLANRPTGG